MVKTKKKNNQETDLVEQWLKIWCTLGVQILACPEPIRLMLTKDFITIFVKRLNEMETILKNAN